MRPQFATVLLFFFIYAHVQAQNWTLGQQFESNGNVVVTSVIVDDQDNSYVLGTFDTDDLIISGHTFTLKGDVDIFLCSFTSDGTYRWGVTMGGLGKEAVGNISLDGSGNIYVGGSFRDYAIYFTPSDSLENVNNFDAFVAVYTTSGTFQWAKHLFWGTNTEKILDIEFNRSKNTFAVVGNFKTELIYSDGTNDQTITAVGPKDQYIAEFNASGDFINIKHYVVTVKYTALKDISICAAGGYFIGGDLVDKIYFTQDDSAVVNPTQMDILVLRVDDNLNFLWSRTATGTGYDHVNSAGSDIYSNYYFTGKTGADPLIFDSTATLKAAPLPGFGGMDLYLAKYNRDGDLQWVRRNGSPGADNAYGIALHENLVEFAGMYSGQIIFNQDTLDSGSSSNINTGFAVYSTSGQTIGAQEIKGDLEDIGTTVTIDQTGQTLIGGYFTSTQITAGTFTFTNTNSPNSDGFLFHYEYPLSVTVKTSSVTCNGGSDGSATVTPYFGTSPYTYEWSYDDGTADSTLTNVPAGDYWVKVTDANNKTDSVAFTISEPTAIRVTASITDVTCPHGTDGAIDITVTGGSQPYSYLWTTTNGSGVNQTLEDQNGLTAGDYSLTITDDHGCTLDTSFTVEQPDPITFAGSSVTDIVRPPGANGAIDLNVQGGTPAYTYSWEGPSGFSATTEDLSGLDVGGDYKVTVKDQAGCLQDTTFLVGDNTALIASIDSVKDVSCYNGSDGYAHVTVTGGSGDYVYAWTNSVGASVGSNSPSLSDVPMGTYNVTVTDQTDNRTASTSVRIAQPSEELTVQVPNIQNVTCNGKNDGKIDITVTGGWVPYTYSWIGPNGFTATTEDIANLAPGNYSVTVIDNNNCVVKKTDITISEPPALTVSIDVIQGILCNGDLTGELEAQPLGGTLPYAYQWDDPGAQTTKTASYLEAGTYTVMVTDGNGCTAQATKTLSEPLPIEVNAIINDVTCPGNSDGSIITTVSGGTAPFNYLWTPGNVTGKDLSDVPAGDYTLTVTDANNCTSTFDFTISEPPALVIDSAAVTDVSGCFGDANGAITVYASGGTSPLEYSIDGGTTFQSDSHFTGLASGDYTVAVRDANGCLLNGNTYTVAGPSQLSILIVEMNDPTCASGNDGSLVIHAGGGTLPYQFSIDGGSTFQDDSTFQGLAAGTYSLRVKDAHGCTAESSAQLNAPPGLTLDEQVTDISCHGETDGKIVILASGGTRPYSYSIDGGTTFQNDSAFVDLSAGDYDIAVQDGNGCVTAGNTVRVNEPDALVIVSTDATPTCPSDKDGTISVTAAGGTPPLSYLLMTTEGARVDSSTDGSFTSLEIGTYQVMVNDANGCGPVTSETITVEEGSDCSLIIYNAFSPNGDGKNDVWNIRGIQGYPDCIVKVFNVWGKQVFSSKGYTEPWDGTYEGKELPAGTYYYIIELGPGEKTYSGTVNIVK